MPILATGVVRPAALHAGVQPCAHLLVLEEAILARLPVAPEDAGHAFEKGRLRPRKTAPCYARAPSHIQDMRRPNDEARRCANVWAPRAQSGRFRRQALKRRQAATGSARRRRRSTNSNNCAAPCQRVSRQASSRRRVGGQGALDCSSMQIWMAGSSRGLLPELTRRAKRCGINSLLVPGLSKLRGPMQLWRTCKRMRGFLHAGWRGQRATPLPPPTTPTCAAELPSPGVTGACYPP